MTRIPDASPWIVTRMDGRSFARRIFCFHHAGGSANDFMAWRPHLGDAYDLVGVQLPGRGRRSSESPMLDIDSIAGAAFEALRGHIGGDYVLAGHSMGGLLAFEVAHRIQEASLPMPLLLSASAAAAPSRQIPSQTHTLPRDAFIDSLRRYGGLPEVVTSDRALMDFFLPILRADTQVYESYRYRPRAPLACAILAMVGSDDHSVPLERARDWRHETAVGCRLDVIPGGHFFSKTNPAATVASIVRAAERGLGLALTA